MVNSRVEELADEVQARDSANALLTSGYRTMPREDAERFAEKLVNFQDIQTTKRWSNLISAEAFLAYAARGFQDATGVEIPIPDLAKQYLLSFPVLSPIVGGFKGDAEHQLERIANQESNKMTKVLKGAGISASQTAGAAIVGYGVGYAVGKGFNNL